MKPPKNKKVSHYNVAQPWVKGPKVRKPKKTHGSDTHFANMVQDDEIAFGVLSMNGITKAYKTWHSKWYGDSNETEFVNLYIAKAADPNATYVGADLETIEGVKVLVSKKRIVMNPVKLSEYVPFFCYSPMCFSSERSNRRLQLKLRVGEFLDKPLPEPPESALILPEEFEKQRRQEHYKDTMATFIEGEVAYQLEPLQKDVSYYRDNNITQSAKIIGLAMDKENLENNLATLERQVEQLQRYKARVEAASASLGERTRHFRVED